MFEALGGSYIRVGDSLLSNLIITDSTHLGKWGILRKQYLKEHRPALYSSMLLTGKLDQYLEEIDQACQERMGLIVVQLQTSEGITESLKASNQMEWVRRASSARCRAEEIVLHELVYCRGGDGMLILEDLYLGDIRHNERSFKRNSQYAKALDEIVKAVDALTDGLTERQKEQFEEYMTAQREVMYSPIVRHFALRSKWVRRSCWTY